MTFLAAEFVLKVAFFLSLACLARGSADTSTCGQKFQQEWMKMSFVTTGLDHVLLRANQSAGRSNVTWCAWRTVVVFPTIFVMAENRVNWIMKRRRANASLYEQTDECDYYGYEFSEQVGFICLRAWEIYVVIFFLSNAKIRKPFEIKCKDLWNLNLWNLTLRQWGIYLNYLSLLWTDLKLLYVRYMKLITPLLFAIGKVSTVR